MESHLVATEKLTKRFGPHAAVDGLDLTVRRGDVYGFLGLNGAGKTTTLRMILGLIRPTSGRVSLFGRSDRAGRRLAMTRIGALVESPAFYDHLTGAQNLRLLGALSSPDTRDRVDEVLVRVGLADARDRKAGQYSLGMKQRLAIALALVSDPELVILDEPTNGLDPNGILEMRRLIRALNEEHGVTFIVSSHLLHEIEMTCNRVAFLERGRLVLEEELEALAASARTRYVLDATPSRRARALLDETGLAREVETLEDGRFRFEADRDALPAIHRALGADDVEVFTFSEERMTLEEIFLERAGSGTSGVLS